MENKKATASDPELLGIKEKLEAKINAGVIIFDTGKEARLKDELLNKVTGKLQRLVLFLSEEVSTKIRISDLIRSSGSSHHAAKRAVDLGNEEIAKQLLPIVATQANVDTYEIDELIFDASVSGKPNRNEWNYNAGTPHNYNSATLDDHDDHIHFSVSS